MTRVVIENILLFLLPFLLWIGYAYLTREERPDGTSILNEAPLAWLIAAGAVLVIATLVLFGSREGGTPGKPYEPPVLKDGKIEPGHTRSAQ
jgi:uncharacterized RDD family membrane protein YckC